MGIERWLKIYTDYQSLSIDRYVSLMHDLEDRLSIVRAIHGIGRETVCNTLAELGKFNEKG